ncbi:CGH_1_HP_G0019300.mRNA.1.CDS.1 [Saccharomyces cerevisiae]|nr:CGH_1_HP_G0019300.mRNA.1.CDS.1 [Saccharomyces cerevisiae]CAI6449162.1 CGH_1_HP_G0019300.mRNA.1.CDS.1 [Saccharomyces cerevisiae]
MDRPIDDIVKNLLKFVVRGFYGGSFVLVLDAILFHSVLAEDDLKQLLSINKTELGPLIARLRSDRLISIHKQREYPPNSKSVERVYYYVKYPHAIDAIKWKVHQVVQRLKDDLDKNSEPNGYMCPICLTKYTQLEAVQLLNFDRTEFLCSLCDEPLVEDDSGKKNKEKQDKLNRLMDQIQPIIDSLKKIDDSRIEENTFEIALARLIPPQNQSHAAYTYNPKKGSTMFRPGDSAPLPNLMGTALGNDSSRRAGANSQATLHINITTASDEVAQRELQERQAEEKRKQNAVPEWHKQSTIGKTALGRLDNEEEFDPVVTASAMDSINPDNEPAQETSYQNNRTLTEQEMEERENEKTLNDYYAALAKKQAKLNKEEEEEEEEEEDEEEEEEEEMEDVMDDNDETARENALEDEFEDVTDTAGTAKTESNTSNDVKQESINDKTEDAVNATATASGPSANAKPNDDDDDDDDDDDEMDIEFEDV